ncbi:hypothetical protein H9Q69_007849 [Fusarium xylarioides]|nr:hypothetical protein H9Q69_007849 [Fusarium xylarioides]
MAERDSWYDDLMQPPEAAIEDLETYPTAFDDMESINSDRTHGPGVIVPLDPTASEFIPSASTVLQDSAVPSTEPPSVPSTFPIASTIASMVITAQTTIPSEQPNESDTNQGVNSPVSTPLSPSKEADEDHDDQASITSLSSATYTPQQRKDAIERFNRAMRRKLNHSMLHVVADDVSRPLVVSKFRIAIKDFTQAVDVDDSIKPQMQGVKMIRRLRSEIANKLHDSVVKTAQGEEKEEGALNDGALGDGAPLGLAEKMRNWLPETDVAALPDHFAAADRLPTYNPAPSEAWSDDRSSVSFGEGSEDGTEVGFKLGGAPNIYGQFVDPLAVLEALTNQPAFDQLIRTVEDCIQQYHGDKMHLIRQQTSLSLRRYYPQREGENTILDAVFNVGWDLKSFLVENYQHGIHQELGKVIAITGTIETARLCSVSQYMKWLWRHKSPQLLMVLEQAMLGGAMASKTSNFLSGISKKNKITVDPSLRTINVSGKERFIVMIAQQLSWLAAAFQEKKDSLTYAVPPRRAQVEKLQFGFSQWGTITAEVAIGKKDGYCCQRPDDYDALLDDAKNTHIILYDTAQRRAAQTNAEDLILHVLHHQRNNKSKDTHSNTPYQGQDIDFAHPDRRVTPTREVMLRNAERVFCHRRQFSSSDLKPCLFKHEFKSLYTTIDGLWAQDYVNQKSHAMRLSLSLKPSISGWEYMDLVESRRWIPPKSVNLRKKCGRWNEYARDIQALILFGSGFGDILRAAQPSSVCPALTSVPKDHFCLGVRVETLERLFTVQGSLADQSKLTTNGLTLSGSNDLFKANDETAGQRCCPRRLVQFIKPALRKGKDASLSLETNGAVIIGDFGESILHKDCVQKRSRKTFGQRPEWLRLDNFTYPMPMRPRSAAHQAQVLVNIVKDLGSK